MEDKTLLSMMDAKLSMQRLWQYQDSRVGRTITNDPSNERAFQVRFPLQWIYRHTLV